MGQAVGTMGWRLTKLSRRPIGVPWAGEDKTRPVTSTRLKHTDPLCFGDSFSICNLKLSN